MSAPDALVREQSAGRSSTRLHAPPGGHSSMGTSFSWGADDAPMPSRRGGRSHGLPGELGQASSGGWTGAGQEPQTPTQDAFRQLSSSAHIAAEAGMTGMPSYDTSPNTLNAKGFGDTGSSCVRLHAPAGGANAMGSSFAWSEENVQPPPTPNRPKDAYAEHMRAQNGSGLPQSASSQQFSVGSQVQKYDLNPKI